MRRIEFEMNFPLLLVVSFTITLSCSIERKVHDRLEKSL